MLKIVEPLSCKIVPGMRTSHPKLSKQRADTGGRERHEIGNCTGCGRRHRAGRSLLRTRMRPASAWALVPSGPARPVGESHHDRTTVIKRESEPREHTRVIKKEREEPRTRPSSRNTNECRRSEVPDSLAANRVQGLQIESGTRIMDLLVPMTFRSPRKGFAAMERGLRKVAPVGVVAPPTA